MNTGGGGAIGINYFQSDERLKKNIVDIENVDADSIFSQVRFVSFDYINTGISIPIGFIAQELFKIYPATINTTTDGMMFPNTNIIITLLMKSAQEQSAKIASLNQRLTKLEALINNISVN